MTVKAARKQAHRALCIVLAALLSVTLPFSATLSASAAGTETARLTGAAQVKTIYQSTQEYLIENVAEPSIGSTGGEWAVLGLARSGASVPTGYYEDYCSRVATEVSSKQGVLHSRKYTEYSRVCLALTSIGVDPRDVAGYDLLAPLADFDKTVWQGCNGAAYALLAFDSGNYDIPEAPAGASTVTTREGLVDHLLSKQVSDGGWALSGTSSDVDLTAMVVQALAPYKSKHAGVSSAIDDALVFLSRSQGSDGSFGSSGAITSESCSQVLVALCTLGVDPLDDSRFIKSGKTVVDALCSFAVDGGGFKHVASGERDGMATEQGFYALVAYERFLAGKNALYDMSDVGKSDIEPVVGPSSPSGGDDGEKPVASGDDKKSSDKSKAKKASTFSSKKSGKTKAEKSSASKKTVTASSRTSSAPASSSTQGALASVEALIRAALYPSGEELPSDYSKLSKAQLALFKRAYSAYEKLSEDERSELAGGKDFSEALEKLAAINHEDASAGLRIDGAPWYVKVVVTSAAATDAGREAASRAGTVGDELKCVDVQLIDVLTGTAWTPGAAVDVFIAVDTDEEEVLAVSESDGDAPVLDLVAVDSGEVALSWLKRSCYTVFEGDFSAFASAASSQGDSASGPEGTSGLAGVLPVVCALVCACAVLAFAALAVARYRQGRKEASGDDGEEE